MIYQINQNKKNVKKTFSKNQNQRIMLTKMIKINQKVLQKLKKRR